VTAIAALTIPEARPLSDAAKATMQTNSGGRIGDGHQRSISRDGDQRRRRRESRPLMARQSIWHELFSCVTKI